MDFLISKVVATPASATLDIMQQLRHQQVIVNCSTLVSVAAGVEESSH